MKSKRECTIVQDLLPNYIEGLTNEETNKFIEEHIKECCECKKILENMQKEIKINEPKRQEKEIDYIKKYNKKLKLLKKIQIAVLIVLIIYVISVVGRMITLVNIQKRGKQTLETSNNYHITSYAYQKYPTCKLVQNDYYKEGKRLFLTEVYNDYDPIGSVTPEYSKITCYSDGKEETTIQENSNSSEKYVVIQEQKTRNYMFEPAENSFIDNLAYSMYKRIGKIKIDDKKCYWLKYDNRHVFIDIETGLIVKSIENEGMILDYKYEFGTVTDQNVVRPNLTGLKVNDMR